MHLYYQNHILDMLLIKEYEETRQLTKTAYNLNLTEKQVKETLLRYDYKKVPGKRYMERIPKQERLENIAKSCLSWILDLSCSASYMPSCTSMLNTLGITKAEAIELGCGEYFK